MGCIDCFDNCQNIYSDRCIKYTGTDVPLLGICSGDSLSTVEAILIDKLQGALDSTECTIEGITLGCSFLTTLLNGKPQTLENIVQVLLDGECNLKASIDALNTAVFAPLTLIAPCLTIPSGSTRDQVLQIIITKLCSLDTQVATISSDYVKNSELCAKVNACITVSTQFNSRMVPYVAYPYHGPLSNFDAGGIGLSANGFDKVYICNGQTVGVFLTPDYRGRSPLGSNVGVPGGALDSNVDPALPANAGYGVTIGNKLGSFTNTLTITQLPGHNHTVTDSGHTHEYLHPTARWGSADNGVNHNFNSTVAQTIATSSSSITGITIGSTGSDQPHNSTHPIMTCNFIIYVP